MPNLGSWNARHKISLANQMPDTTPTPGWCARFQVLMRAILLHTNLGMSARCCAPSGLPGRAFRCCLLPGSAGTEGKLRVTSLYMHMHICIVASESTLNANYCITLYYEAMLARLGSELSWNPTLATSHNSASKVRTRRRFVLTLRGKLLHRRCWQHARTCGQRARTCAHMRTEGAHPGRVTQK